MNPLQKAKELCAKYGDPVVCELNAWAWPDGTTKETWRVHVVGDGIRNVCEQDEDLVRLEAEIARQMDPANKMAAALARAEKLEAEAAALRAEVAK